MPYGISWPRYISLVSLSFMLMAAGSQCVHLLYKPLDDLEDLIEEALQKRLSEQTDEKK